MSFYRTVLCRNPQFCLFCYASFKTEVYNGNSDALTYSPEKWITVTEIRRSFTEISPLFHRMFFKEIGDCDIVIATSLSLLLPTPFFNPSEFELSLLHYISKELYFS